MFIKHTRKRANGKTYDNYMLVQSKSTPNGPRQDVICQLGSLPPGPEEEWRSIAAQMEAELNGQTLIEAFVKPGVKRLMNRSHEKGLLAEEFSEVESWKRITEVSEADEDWITINANSLKVGDSCAAGAVHVGHQIWKMLDMDDIIASAGVPAALTEIAVINCLVEPGSDHAIRDWVDRTALPDILGMNMPPVNDTALYRNLDKLHPERKEIEKKLSERENSLFSMDNMICLYDLTSTYFEGICSNNEKAKRGYSRDQRPDAKQVVVGLSLNRFGFPAAHEVLEGNRNDATTVEEMLDALNERSSIKRGSTITVDRGMSSKENLQLIKSYKDLDLHYIVAARQSERDQWLSEFEGTEGWECVVRELSPTNPYQKKAPVKIKKVEQENEIHVLCISDGRKSKDKAIRETHEKRLLADLEKLSKRISSGKLVKEDLIHQYVGRLKERYPRVHRYYNICFDSNSSKLSWHEVAELKQKAEELDGGYLIKTDRKDLSHHELWHIYMLLNRVENAFRDIKGPLGLRPIFHQLADRVETHIFIAILAFHLLATIEKLLTDAGDHRSWETVRKVLSTHQVMTISMKIKTGHNLLIRQATVPEPEHKEIYKALKIPAKIIQPLRVLCAPAPVPTPATA
ncbi:MAG: IS1634 family transposase [Nitrososphaerales archaeon]